MAFVKLSTAYTIALTMIRIITLLNSFDDAIAYAQFYDGLVDTTNNGLDSVEEAIQSHSDSIKGKLEELWNSESFSDTQKSIVEMANALDGITADNIETLAESSEELAALLDEDGMSAKFLAHVLQTEVTSGNGFELITDDALTLNSALEGLKGL